MKTEKSDTDKPGGAREDKSSDDEEFLGFSPPTDKTTNKAETVVSKADILQASAMARQLHVYKPGIDFVPGARLEVLDARDNNWYQCKIVEVDWGELDILVHYERWSNRFDEWLKMDSTRIRSLSRSSQRRDRKSGAFSVGDRVLARWSADGKRYQARVTKELGDDQYEVLFFDGVAKVLRSPALTKVDGKPGDGDDYHGGPSRQQGTDDEDSLLMSPGATSASSTDSRSSSPEPQHSAGPSRAAELMEVETVSPVRKNIFDVEIMEKKRKSKRKAAVEELFQSLRKRRKIEIGTRFSTPSPRRQQQHVKPGPSKKTSLPKKKARESPSAHQEDPAGHQGEAAPSEAPDSPLPTQAPKIVSVEMHDGWKKCCSQRTHGSTAGKWDTFYLAPDGKKIRCKSDLYRYCEDMGITCDIEKFDFSLRNMKEIIEAQTEQKDSQKSLEEQKEPEKEPLAQQAKKEPEVKSPPPEMSSIKVGITKKIEIKKPESRVTEPSHSESPRMKLEIPLIPKTEHLGTLPPSLLGSAVPWSPTLPSPPPPSRLLPATSSALSGNLVTKDAAKGSGYVPSEPVPEPPPKPAITPIRQRHVLKKEPVLAPNEFVVRAQHNEHQCPKEGCGKSFRKENLLQMHIKHYHPGLLKKTSSWAPNVADLAYARTVGDHLDNSSSSSHSPPSEKVVKSEAASKKPMRGLLPLSFLDTRGKAEKKIPMIKTLPAVKDIRKKEKAKHEPELGPLVSEDETESKEEVDDYPDDLGESPMSSHGLHIEDPDYVPCDDDMQQMRKERRERRKTRAAESKTKKKKLGEPSVSEPTATLTSPTKKTQGAEADVPNIDVEEDTGDTWVEGTESVPTSEPSAEIINCGCGSTEEEGLMLQCDVCLCWQHGDCYNIVGEDQVPDKYICSLCDHPRLERSSHKFRHHQDWLKEGRLPRFSFSSSRGDVRLETCIRRGHELTANILQLSQVLQSLRLKLHISKEADHPKFVMWHKKWDEQEEATGQGREETCSSQESVAPLQDLMNIVQQEDPCLGTQMVDNKVPGQTHDLVTSPSLERAITGEPEKLDSGRTIFPGSWDVPGPAVTETQESDVPHDRKEDMSTPRDEAGLSRAAMDVTEHPEEGSSNVPEASGSDCEAPEDAPKAENEQKKDVDVESSTAPQVGEPEISLPSEEGLHTLESKPTELKEQSVQDKEEDKDIVESDTPERTTEDTTQTAEKEESSVTQEKTDDGNGIMNMDTDNTDSAKRDDTAPGSADDTEETLEPSDGGQSKEAPLHDSPQTTLPSCEESVGDVEATDKPTPETVNVMDVEEVKESKAETPTESEAEPVKKEEAEDLLEDKTKITPLLENVNQEHQIKQSEDSCKTDETPVKKEDNEVEPMDVDEGVTAEGSMATDASKIPEKAEGLDDAKTEKEEMKDPIKDSKPSDEEQEKVTDSSFAPSAMPPSGADDTLTEEETHLEDGDELALDLGGLGATGEGGMPGGNELAALLSSNSELEQLVTQASSALAPVTGNVHSVQAPIIPEAERIEPVNCKLNLLEHVQAMQTSITQRFDEIEQQLEVLEAEMGLTADAGEDETEEDSEERDPATLQARALIKLVMNDLSIVKKIADFTH